MNRARHMSLEELRDAFERLYADYLVEYPRARRTNTTVHDLTEFSRWRIEKARTKE